MKTLAVPQAVYDLNDVLIGPAGILESAVRQAIVAETVSSTNHGHPVVNNIPAHLQDYLEKVAHASYKVMDKDINQLKRADYSEDEIFEMTVCVAFGAALARIEKGFGLLED